MKKTILAILGLAMFFTVSLFAQQTPVTKANYELAERFSPKKLNRMVFSQSAANIHERAASLPTDSMLAYCLCNFQRKTLL